MKTNLIKDLSTLTTINEFTINKLSDKVKWCIADAVEEAMLNNDEVIDISVGFGSLLILVSNNEIRYKFKPSLEFEKTISDTVINERNDLVNALETSLVDKVVNTYKNFF